MRGYQLVSAASADHQAEDARVSQGVFASDHTGYSGSGFVNYDNVTGGYVEWTFNSNAAATATLDLRYANGTAANRPMDIAVNGTVVSAGRAFDPTGSWDTWATSSLSVPLKSGTNTVRATATTSSGGPNVDKITVR
ncbi:carbohydrate-binding protein [Streptomyces cocklensis]|nr:carbohydrate-binding protein [Actinacidiphila cocklensis]MDD1062650.1 carbohydrate-binding protein [Actinacidiphila cocklensis]